MIIHSDTEDDGTTQEIINSSAVDREDMDPDQLTSGKMKMESDLRKKQIMLQENRVWIEDISEDLRDTLLQMRECEIENECYPMKINAINMTISELENQLSSLKKTREETEEKLEDYNKELEELSVKKTSLDAEFNRRIEIDKTIKEEIADLADGIQQNLKRKKCSLNRMDSNKKLLYYLIDKKEKDLECPVCLLTASVPIFSCPENHLICSVCRPQMTECPECRLEYRDDKKPRRHRYAEKMVEELDIMKKETN